MEIVGKLEQVMNLVTGTSTNGEWKKREFLIATMDQYPKKVFFSVWGDKTSLLDAVRPGEEIKVFFDPSSREYNGRWYTELRAWRIDKNSAGQQPQHPGVVEHVENNNAFDPMSGGNNNAGGFDDLPF